MGKSTFNSLKESARNKAWTRSTVGRPDRKGQYTYVLDELPKNLESLTEYRRRKQKGGGK